VSLAAESAMTGLEETRRTNKKPRNLRSAILEALLASAIQSPNAVDDIYEYQDER
jgi:hypothetical protein